MQKIKVFQKDRLEACVSDFAKALWEQSYFECH